jgi:hypothetical protein
MAGPSKRKRRVWLSIGGVVLAVLMAAVFTVGSLDVRMHSEHGNAFVLFAISDRWDRGSE